MKKGKVASKVAKKNRELMTPLGMNRISDARSIAASKMVLKKGKPSFDSLHRLRRLSMNTALEAEARIGRRRIGTGLALAGAGVGGYQLGKKKKKNK